MEKKEDYQSVESFDSFQARIDAQVERKYSLKLINDHFSAEVRACVMTPIDYDVTRFRLVYPHEIAFSPCFNINPKR